MLTWKVGEEPPINDGLTLVMNEPAQFAVQRLYALTKVYLRDWEHDWKDGLAERGHIDCEDKPTDMTGIDALAKMAECDTRLALIGELLGIPEEDR